MGNLFTIQHTSDLRFLRVVIDAYAAAEIIAVALVTLLSPLASDKLRPALNCDGVYSFFFHSLD